MERHGKHSYSYFLFCLDLITWAVNEQFRPERAIWLYLSAQFKITKEHLQVRGSAIGIVYKPQWLAKGGETQLSKVAQLNVQIICLI